MFLTVNIMELKEHLKEDHFILIWLNYSNHSDCFRPNFLLTFFRKNRFFLYFYKNNFKNDTQFLILYSI